MRACHQRKASAKSNSRPRKRGQENWKTLGQHESCKASAKFMRCICSRDGFGMILKLNCDVWKFQARKQARRRSPMVILTSNPSFRHLHMHLWQSEGTRFSNATEKMSSALLRWDANGVIQRLSDVILARLGIIHVLTLSELTRHILSACECCQCPSPMYLFFCIKTAVLSKIFPAH